MWRLNSTNITKLTVEESTLPQAKYCSPKNSPNPLIALSSSNDIECSRTGRSGISLHQPIFWVWSFANCPNPGMQEASITSKDLNRSSLYSSFTLEALPGFLTHENHCNKPTIYDILVTAIDLLPWTIFLPKSPKWSCILILFSKSTSTIHLFCRFWSPTIPHILTWLLADPPYLEAHNWF